MSKNFSHEGLTIGSKIFIVHNSYAHQRVPGGSVSQARIVGFVNVNGIIQIRFRQVGQKCPVDLSLKHWTPFVDIKEALKSIES